MLAKLAALILGPLIERNLRQRAAGELSDEWYWADLLAMRLGYIHESEPSQCPSTPS